MAKNNFPDRYAEELAVHALITVLKEVGYSGIMLEHDGNKHVFIINESGHLQVWDADDLDLSVPFKSGLIFNHSR